MITDIPDRSSVNPADTWDLSKLFPSDDAWSRGLDDLERLAGRIPGFRGTLGRSAGDLAAWLEFTTELGILEERLGGYAGLRQTEDEGDGAARTMTGRFEMAAARIAAASAWAAPEILAIPETDLAAWLHDEPRLADHRIALERLLRRKPHTLSDREERIIALHAEAEGVPSDAFSVLTNVDLDFGALDTPDGPRPLTQSTWSVFMENPDRGLRRRAYETFYRRFNEHRHTLASLYAGSVKLDVVRARVRGFPTARAAALFPDNVPEAVYDNLVATVEANLTSLHRYYRLRAKALGLTALRHYDVYAPLTPAGAADAGRRTWAEAVDMVSTALAPLGDEYVSTLRAGLLGRWADRYENQGKRSGAFSAGGFTGDPYILMNYKEDALRDVFTLAHEGGHSMHSWYSARSNPFMHYNYTIFEAEVASTFNEELLYRGLVSAGASAGGGGSPGLRRYLVNRRADEILATLYRQTMFASFERRVHDLEESGVPLTVDTLRAEYRALLERYFGEAVVLEPESDLECLRIPHFYNAFYVYKYATGISASLALAERVLQGGAAERDRYLAFLRSGGSRFPIDSLKAAGVDMSTPAPVEAACRAFDRLVDELEGLLA